MTCMERTRERSRHAIHVHKYKFRASMRIYTPTYKQPPSLKHIVCCIYFLYVCGIGVQHHANLVCPHLPYTRVESLLSDFEVSEEWEETRLHREQRTRRSRCKRSVCMYMCVCASVCMCMCVREAQTGRESEGRPEMERRKDTEREKWARVCCVNICDCGCSHKCPRLTTSQVKHIK